MVESSPVQRKRAVVFPWQQWLRERTTMLRYTYIVHLVNVKF